MLFYYFYATVLFNFVLFFLTATKTLFKTNEKIKEFGILNVFIEEEKEITFIIPEIGPRTNAKRALKF